MKMNLFFLLFLVAQGASGQLPLVNEVKSPPTDLLSPDANKKKSVSTDKPAKQHPTDTSNIRSVYIDFVGSGDIQKSFTEGEEIKANTGMGVIFEKYNGLYKPVQSFELEGVINIASTSDSIKSKYENARFVNRRNFGSYVLNPVSTRQSLFINSNVYFGYPMRKHDGKHNDEKQKDLISRFGHIAGVVSGMNIRVIASNNIWTHEDTAVNLGVLAARIGVFHEFIPDNFRFESGDKRSRFSIYAGVYYTARGLIGDITSSVNEPLRIDILGSDKTFFHGVEFNFGFKLNNLRAEFQLPVLMKGNNPSIDGLTNAQFLFSIKFVGGFPLRIKPVKLASK